MNDPVDDVPRPSPETGDYVVIGHGGAHSVAAPRKIDLADLTPPEPPPVPPGQFYATVYFFPLRWGVIVRWLLIAAGLIPPLAIVAAILDYGTHGFSSWNVQLGLAILALPLGILLLWAVAYAGVVFLCVLEVTAAGADRIESWPDSDWTDWLGQLIHLAYAFVIAGVVSFSVGRYVNDAVQRLIVWWDPQRPLPSPEGLFEWIPWAGESAVLLFLVLPIVLLSTQQSEFRWMPLTGQVARSLVRPETSRLWLLFYAAALPLVVVPCAQVIFTRPGTRFQGAAGLGLLVAGAILIYARLLGRLAWQIGQHQPEVPEEDDVEPDAQNPDDEFDEDPNALGDVEIAPAEPTETDRNPSPP